MYHLYTVVIDSLSLSILEIQAWKRCWLSSNGLMGMDLDPLDSPSSGSNM